MNKFFKVHLNWRINVLAVMAMMVTVLVVSDSDSIFLLFLTKTAGFFLGYLTFRLSKYWDSKDKVNELRELADEE